MEALMQQEEDLLKVLQILLHDSDSDSDDDEYERTDWSYYR
jgi:hypothetical protein